MTSIRLSSLLAVLLLAGCTTVQYRPVPLPLPARPTLTPIKADAFSCPPGVILPAPWTMCITDATYTALANRQTGYKTWGLQLEAIIKANNAKAKP
jgi:hypothetical protein